MKARSKSCQVVQCSGTVELRALKEHLLCMWASCQGANSRVVQKANPGDTGKCPGAGPKRSQWGGTNWEAGEAMREDAKQEAAVDGRRPLV